MNRKDLLKVKLYLDDICSINHVLNENLAGKFKDVYRIVYKELNGVDPYSPKLECEMQICGFCKKEYDFSNYEGFCSDDCESNFSRT